jgi:hypothetical protein
MRGGNYYQVIFVFTSVNESLQKLARLLGSDAPINSALMQFQQNPIDNSNSAFKQPSVTMV